MSIKTIVNHVFSRGKFEYEKYSIKEPYMDSSGPVDPSFWPLMDIVYRQLTYIFFSFFMVLLVGYLATWIFAGPNAVSGLIANILGQVCLKTGECRIEVLLPGFATANIILIYLVIHFVWLIDEWSQNSSTMDAMSSVLGVLRDHTDFMNDIQYKIVQLSRGEQIAPTLTEPKPLPEIEQKKAKSLYLGFSIGLFIVLVGSIVGILVLA